MWGFIGLVLEAFGIAIILGTQAVFVLKARKKYGSIGTAFLMITAMRWGMNKEKVEETVKDKQKLKEALKKFPHAEWLYEDFKYSVIGLTVGLLGLLCQILDPYFFELANFLRCLWS